MVDIRLLSEGDAEEFIRLRLEGLQESPHAFGSSWVEECDNKAEDVRPRLAVSEQGNFVVARLRVLAGCRGPWGWGPKG